MTIPADIPSTDDELLVLLARALEDADPVPTDVLAMARAVPVLADLDSALAQLTFDSAAELAGVRGVGTGRQLNFETDAADLVLVIGDADGTTVVDGQLVPEQEADVEVLRHTEVVATVRTDALGRFRLSGLPAGPLRRARAGRETA